METKPKREIPQAQKDEGAAMGSVITAYNQKNPKAKISLTKIAENLGMTSTGFNHYIRGKNPLNIHVALRVAKMFNVSVSSFSPRLAEELSLILEMASHESTPALSPSVARNWFALNEKLILLPHTPIPGLAALTAEIEAERAEMHSAVRKSLTA